MRCADFARHAHRRLPIGHLKRVLRLTVCMACSGFDYNAGNRTMLRVRVCECMQGVNLAKGKDLVGANVFHEEVGLRVTVRRVPDDGQAH